MRITDRWPGCGHLITKNNRDYVEGCTECKEIDRSFLKHRHKYDRIKLINSIKLFGQDRVLEQICVCGRVKPKPTGEARP